MNEEQYTKIVEKLSCELEVISKKFESNLPELNTLKNIQFELQVLLHALTSYVQYDEEDNVVITDLSGPNKDRLIGFLASKI